MNQAELKKNIWLHDNKISFVAITVIFILAIALNFSFTNDSNALENIFSISVVFFGIFTSFWGTLTLSHSLISEVRNRTWMFQKMSALSAFDVSVGRLIGPVYLHWIFGLAFLAIGLISAFLSHSINMSGYILLVLQLIISTIIFHSTALILSLLMIKRKSYQQDVGNINITPIILMMVVLLSILINFFKADETQSFIWYGWHVNKNFFNTASLLFFAAWALIGLYRNMQNELNYNTKPLVWVAFNTFMVVYFSGLVVNDNTLDEFNLFKFIFVIAYAVLVATILITVLLESSDKIKYRELLTAIQEKNKEALVKNMPLWVITLLFCLPVALLLSIKLSFIHDIDKLYYILPFTVLLYLVKSVLVNVYLHITGVSHANLLWFFYLVIWYGLLPAFLISGSSWKSAFVFYPSNPIISTVLGFFYVAIMLFLVSMAVRKNRLV